MRRALAMALGAVIALAACGGTHHAGPGPNGPPPVAQQLRAVLDNGFNAGTVMLGSLHQPRSPVHAHVRACSGPPDGRAGTYVCRLVPTGRGFAPRSLTVRVTPDGTWSATIPPNPREHERSLHGVWGAGLRIQHG